MSHATSYKLRTTSLNLQDTATIYRLQFTSCNLRAPIYEIQFESCNLQPVKYGLKFPSYKQQAGGDIFTPVPVYWCGGTKIYRVNICWAAMASHVATVNTALDTRQKLPQLPLQREAPCPGIRRTLWSGGGELCDL